MNNRRLLATHVSFLVTMLWHNLDHVRQGTGRLTPHVLWGGTLLSILAVGTFPLTVRKSARAPLAAAAVGFGTVIAVALAHLVPHWSAFSDSYLDLSLDGWSWAAMLSEVAGAFVFGLAGLAALRGRAAARAPAPL
jgi:hypothetical protein